VRPASHRIDSWLTGHLTIECALLTHVLPAGWAVSALSIAGLELLRYARRLVTEFDPPDIGDVDDALTGREREVLELIAAGLSNREIAAHIYVATSTVKSYTNSIFRRLGVASRAQVVAEARALHLLSDLPITHRPASQFLPEPADRTCPLSWSDTTRRRLLPG
jgi:DNA-binding CsgD family transcriptional regulator